MAKRIDILVCGTGATGLEALAALSERAPSSLRIAAIESGDEIALSRPRFFFRSQEDITDLQGFAAARFTEERVRTYNGYSAAHTLESRLLDDDAYVADRLAKAKGIPIVTGCRVLRSHHRPDGVVLSTNKGDVRASVVIDAMGENSPLSAEADILQPDEPRHSLLSRTLFGDEALEGGRLLMDFFDWKLETEIAFARAFPVPGGARYEVVLWSRKRESREKLSAMMDRYLDRRAVFGETAAETFRVHRTGGLHPLHRGRILFAGTSGGLCMPWTGESLAAGLQSARAAVETALAALATGNDPTRVTGRLLRYDRRVHDGRFGITFRTQDIMKDVILRMHPDDITRLVEVFFDMPADLIERYLSGHAGITDNLLIARHFMEHYRFEELPWVAALNGGLAALSAYGRYR